MTVTELTIYPVKSLGGIRVRSARVTDRGLEHDRRWMVVLPDGTFITQRQAPALSRISTGIVGEEIELAAGEAGTVRVPLLPPEDGDRLAVTVWKDEVRAVRAGKDASAWLSNVLGLDVLLVGMPDDARRAPDPAYSHPDDRVSFADGYPLLLTTTASLAEVNRHLPHPVPMSRFRPNVVVPANTPWTEESWRRVELGAVALDVAKPCGRCVVTTVPQLLDEHAPRHPAPTDVPDPAEPLRALARIHTVNGKAVFGVNLIPRGAGRIRVGDQVRTHASVVDA